MTGQQAAPTWTTKAGERIAIRCMSDVHLTNTIRFLRRRADYGVLHMLTTIPEGIRGTELEAALEDEVARHTSIDARARFVFGDKFSQLLFEACNRMLPVAREKSLC